MGFIYQGIQNGFLFYENIVTVSQSICRLDIVSYFAFQTYIRHQPHTSLSIHTREITGIRIAVGISVLYIKDINEINSVLKF